MIEKALLAFILILSWAGFAGCGQALDLDLSSPAFTQNSMIPEEYTGDGENASPELEWIKPPEGTKSFALICEDPDAPSGKFIHWVIYDIPASTRKLARNVVDSLEFADGTKQGQNDFMLKSYRGPAPPPGKPHRYYFKLYALDTMLDLPPGATEKALVEAMKGHILAKGQLMGHYGRAD